MAERKVWTSQDLAEMVRASTDLTLARQKMRLASVPTKGTDEPAKASIEEVQREIRETTSFWQRARRFSNRILRRHHTI